ncbi:MULTISPECIES: pyruvate synthase subunit PorA [Methanobacterium]|jgi:pyruvate ferredoxin oxidoreductase alpha subunit|uniref:Pyruvate synthase subunit PorA n=1 Tax=Methanobacterium veterum TaxID=408577 RepID=A0A9E5A5T4_9EURY|nr:MULTISPECIES: pyruvate synthase subunit PorA [Methanobacterium]MCZ3366485.1 pyruvate synthase subunit PorA [Methanobacterium veterum]MCZ3371993.1 pyruvate synthase subunit PorA [Methanobacterium veterum]
MKVITANRAIAEAVKLAKPKVVPVYPITPQTTISEYLATFVANGDLNAEYIRVESEHSAISAAVGASGTGVRVFTATSSQGLALMHEILFAAAGLRNPIVMGNANRALSAPLSIWNDQQDSISQRDTGWMQFFAEDAQEALDFVLQAYKISENEKVLLPSMVCVDGYYLTHTVEPVDIPTQEEVDEFLPPYKPTHSYLDPKDPMSLGTFTDPNYYMEARHDMEVAMEGAKDVIRNVNKEFAEKFGRKYDLVENYMCDDAEVIIIAMGSLCGTIKAVIDNMRKEGHKVGLLRVIAFRPFPKEDIYNAIKNADRVAVLDKNISLGIGGVLFNEIKAKMDVDARGFILGLGGRDVSNEDIRNIIKITKNSTESDTINWIGLKEEEA